MADLFGVNQGDTQLQRIVDAYKATQQPQLDRLTQAKTNLEKKSSYFNALNTRLNSLITNLDDMSSEDAVENFESMLVESTNNDVVSASADSNAIEGISTVKVNRLASSDLLISKQLDLDSEFGNELSGEHTFKLISGDEEFDITVDFGDPGSNLSNEQALKLISNAINETENINIVASKVKDTSETVRLSLRAKNSGFDNRIQFADSDVLSKLGLINSELNPSDTARETATSDAAGYKISNSQSLNSETEINGVTIIRNSNEIDEVVDGVTFTIKQTQGIDDKEIVLDTQVDTAAVTDYLFPLVNNFNNIMKFMTEQKSITRGEPTANSLKTRMRSLLSERITTVNQGGPEYISAIGFDIKRDGTLQLSDRDLFEKTLKDDPEKISSLFLSEDGVIAKLNNAISTLKGDDGVLKTRTINLLNDIENQQSRIDRMQSRIDKAARVQEKQYTALLESYYQAQSQYQSFNSSIGFSG